MNRDIEMENPSTEICIEEFEAKYAQVSLERQVLQEAINGEFLEIFKAFAAKHGIAQYFEKISVGDYCLTAYINENIMYSIDINIAKDKIYDDNYGCAVCWPNEPYAKKYKFEMHINIGSSHIEFHHNSDESIKLAEIAYKIGSNFNELASSIEKLDWEEYKHLQDVQYHLEYEIHRYYANVKEKKLDTQEAKLRKILKDFAKNGNCLRIEKKLPNGETHYVAIDKVMNKRLLCFDPHYYDKQLIYIRSFAKNLISNAWHLEVDNNPYDVEL